MSIVHTVLQILEQEKDGLHFREIAKKAVILDKTLGPDVDACGKKIAQTLAAHVARHDKKPTALFRRISNGKGGYKPGYYGVKKKSTPKQPKPNDKLESPVATSFTGKAGEYGVFSELLYWGYNPAMMVVDYGVDIVASKDGEYFHIQVKTANPKANKDFFFRIDKKIFQQHYNLKTFYVFVVRRDVRGRQLSDYVIMPSSRISFLMDSGVITSGKDISFTITVENEVFKVNGKFVIPDVNNFSKIR